MTPFPVSNHRSVTFLITTQYSFAWMYHNLPSQLSIARNLDCFQFFSTTCSRISCSLFQMSKNRLAVNIWNSWDSWNKEKFRSLTESKSQVGRSLWQLLSAARGAPISHSSNQGGGSEPKGNSLFSCRIINQGQKEHEGALM